MPKKTKPTKTKGRPSGMASRIRGAITSRKKPPASLKPLGGGEEGYSREGLDLISRAIRYLGLYVYIILVYGGLLVTDYTILRLVTWLLHAEIEKHYVVAVLFAYLKVGLALFVMAGALIHGFLSLITLIKLDIAIARELEKDEKDE